MRNIQTVISGIVALIPATVDPAIQNNITTLRAELTILTRWADYAPAEGSAVLWEKLGTALYRYMPLPSYAPWCAEISALVLQ
jgi:hypothetical protein